MACGMEEKGREVEVEVEVEEWRGEMGGERRLGLDRLSREKNIINC